MADLQFRSEKKYPMLKFYITLLWAFGVFMWLVAGVLFFILIKNDSLDEADAWLVIGTSLVLGFMFLVVSQLVQLFIDVEANTLENNAQNSQLIKVLLLIEQNTRANRPTEGEETDSLFDTLSDIHDSSKIQ